MFDVFYAFRVLRNGGTGPRPLAGRGQGKRGSMSALRFFSVCRVLSWFHRVTLLVIRDKGAHYINVSYAHAPAKETAFAPVI